MNGELEEEPKETEHPLDRAARALVEWAYCDSLLILPRAKLRLLLAEDSEESGYLPTEQECMEFICGDDTGSPPAKLVKDFPRTQAYLQEFWA